MVLMSADIFENSQFSDECLYFYKCLLCHHKGIVGNSIELHIHAHTCLFGIWNNLHAVLTFRYLGFGLPLE